eukprot:1161974-Pelagomonas_calceolata.AAC.5
MPERKTVLRTAPPRFATAPAALTALHPTPQHHALAQCRAQSPQALHPPQLGAQGASTASPLPCPPI